MARNRTRRASRRRKPAKAHRRRRRIGAMALNASNPMVQLGSVVAGFLGANMINGGLIDKVVPVTTNQKLVAGGQVGIGAYLIMRKGRKSLPEVIGGGLLAGAGLKRAMKEFGIMSGFKSVPVVSGYRKVPVLGGYQVPAMNGYQVPASTKIMGNVSASREEVDCGCMK